MTLASFAGFADFERALESAWQRKAALREYTNAYRLLNGSASGTPGLIVDVFGGYLAAYAYDKVIAERCDGLAATFARLTGASGISLKDRSAKGEEGREAGRDLFGSVPESAEVREGPLRFRVHPRHPRNVGLFLDTRLLRRTLLDTCTRHDVLNLFSYSCSLGLAAAHGNQGSVVNVDVSARYLGWGKDDLALNDMPADGMKFVRMDSGKYLDWAARKSLAFDVVILDPPSFSRSEAGTFSFANDYWRLLEKCARLLRPAGRLYALTNFGGISAERFRGNLEETLASSGRSRARDSPASLAGGFRWRRRPGKRGRSRTRRPRRPWRAPCWLTKPSSPDFPHHPRNRADSATSSLRNFTSAACPGRKIRPHRWAIRPKKLFFNQLPGERLMSFQVTLNSRNVLVPLPLEDRNGERMNAKLSRLDTATALVIRVSAGGAFTQEFIPMRICQDATHGYAGREWELWVQKAAGELHVYYLGIPDSFFAADAEGKAPRSLSVQVVGSSPLTGREDFSGGVDVTLQAQMATPLIPGFLSLGARFFPALLPHNFIERHMVAGFEFGGKRSAVLMAAIQMDPADRIPVSLDKHWESKNWIQAVVENLAPASKTAGYYSIKGGCFYGRNRKITHWFGGDIGLEEAGFRQAATEKIRSLGQSRNGAWVFWIEPQEGADLDALLGDPAAAAQRRIAIRHPMMHRLLRHRGVPAATGAPVVPAGTRSSLAELPAEAAVAALVQVARTLIAHQDVLQIALAEPTHADWSERPGCRRGRGFAGPGWPTARSALAGASLAGGAGFGHPRNSTGPWRDAPIPGIRVRRDLWLFGLGLGRQSHARDAERLSGR